MKPVVPVAVALALLIVRQPSALGPHPLALSSRPFSSQAASPRADAAKEKRLEWFREAKYGLFIHWGLYAIPAGEWNGKHSPGLGEWVMLRSVVPVKEYEKLASRFNPVKFNADEWVK